MKHLRDTHYKGLEVSLYKFFHFDEFNVDIKDPKTGVNLRSMSWFDSENEAMAWALETIRLMPDAH